MSGLHNKSTDIFIKQIVRPILLEEKPFSEFMLIMESINLGAMKVLVEMYGFTSRDAATMMDSAIERAIERLVECDTTKS